LVPVERVDGEPYRIPPETGILIPSDFNSSADYPEIEP
jgi:hypothetical protein